MADKGEKMWKVGLSPVAASGGVRLDRFRPREWPCSMVGSGGETMQSLVWGSCSSWSAWLTTRSRMDWKITVLMFHLMQSDTDLLHAGSRSPVAREASGQCSWLQFLSGRMRLETWNCKCTSVTNIMLGLQNFLLIATQVKALTYYYTTLVEKGWESGSCGKYKKM